MKVKWEARSHRVPACPCEWIQGTRVPTDPRKHMPVPRLNDLGHKKGI